MEKIIIINKLYDNGDMETVSRAYRTTKEAVEYVMQELKDKNYNPPFATDINEQGAMTISVPSAIDPDGPPFVSYHLIVIEL